MSDEVNLESQQESQQEAPDEPRMPLPPPTFLFLVLSLRAQCEIQLGLMNYGQTEKAEPDLMLSRHTIDSLEEHRMLENSLTELRFRYVQVSDEVAKAAAQKA